MRAIKNSRPGTTAANTSFFGRDIPSRGDVCSQPLLQGYDFEQDQTPFSQSKMVSYAQKTVANGFGHDFNAFKNRGKKGRPQSNVSSGLISNGTTIRESGLNIEQAKFTKKALPQTKIDIIDMYYANLNTSDEIERATFINEYRRLLS